MSRSSFFPVFVADEGNGSIIFICATKKPTSEVSTTGIDPSRWLVARIHKSIAEGSSVRSPWINLRRATCTELLAQSHLR